MLHQRSNVLNQHQQYRHLFYPNRNSQCKEQDYQSGPF